MTAAASPHPPYPVHVLAPAGTQDITRMPHGTWTRVERGPWHALVMVSCPRCGAATGPGIRSTIDAEGTVQPSWYCPAGRCNFHGYVRLEGWRP